MQSPIVALTVCAMASAEKMSEGGALAPVASALSPPAASVGFEISAGRDLPRVGARDRIAVTAARTGLSNAMRHHAFLFADLCGYTEYTCRHGDLLAAELAVTFHKRARELAYHERCEVIKSIGDAVMVRADDPHDALRLAQRVIALNRSESYPQIRVGVDVGPAIEHAGDWYGSTVNTAARVTEAALPGEVVLTERARVAITGGSDIPLSARGIWKFKGLPEMRLHAARA